MFIALDRTFRELIEADPKRGSSDFLHFANLDTLNWGSLIQEYRVVVLSEAGSGKTEEIRNASAQLFKEGKPSFFLRLEHVVSGFEDAFEDSAGTYDDFQTWLSSDEEGWLFLDSVDEARLTSPNEFEAAIRRIGREIKLAKQRTHIVISGRASAWRRATDLALCSKHLQYQPPSRTITELEANDSEDIPVHRDAKSEQALPFKIVSLNELTPQQMEVFANAKGVADTQAFLKEVDRADAWSFGSRPIDLDELIEFWLENGRIGTRAELMENSVNRRLKEHQEKHVQLAFQKAHAGAVLVAAACTLTRQQTIQYPDGAYNGQGLAIKELLADWLPSECVTLLGLPIFSPAIYGAARIHTRLAREYLTALWVVELLKHPTSRRSIEGILFREQYGLEVVVPTMRPTLPWIAMFDDKIRDRLCKIAPEVFFEGGDPSRLPLQTRRQILRDACDRFANRTSGRAMADLSAVQRFTNVDLADDIGQLIDQYRSNHELVWVLLRMVLHGGLKSLLPQVLSIAKDASSEPLTRIAAIRAVYALGTGQQGDDIRRSFVSESESLNRDVFAALIEDGEVDDDITQWTIQCLGKVSAKPKFSADTLDEALCSFIAKCPLELLMGVISAGNRLVETPPFIERQYCEISKQYSWLLRPLSVAVERLVEARSPQAFDPDSLSVIRKVPILKRYEPYELSDSKINLGPLVQSWPELKMAAFWDLVRRERVVLKERRHERLTNWWQAGVWDSYVAFDADDIGPLIGHITSQGFLDDRLVALSAVFRLYEEIGKPAEVLDQLEAAVLGAPELEERLQVLVNPPEPSEQAKEWQKTLAQSEKKAKRTQKRKMKAQADWKVFLHENTEKLRDPGFDDPSAISQAQAYLMERTRDETNGSNDRPYGQWKSLRKEFGDEVAMAYRDGAVAYWRRHKPQLISEGAPRNSTKLATLFGLAGLEIEARESPGWLKSLSSHDVEVAFRHAMHELNGFPKWFPHLFEAFSADVTRMSLHEIFFELETEDDQVDQYYLLHDVSWSGDWMWDALAPHVADWLDQREPKKRRNLDFVLNIIQGGGIADERLIALASAKVRSDIPHDHVACWFSVWVGVQPSVAIPALDGYLSSLQTSDDQTHVAMVFIAKLLGSRRDPKSQARDGYKTPTYIKALYLLMHRFVRQGDDIERANGGVYSPGLRDDAQDGRERLLEILREMSGKEAFLALSGIAEAHPTTQFRPGLRRLAKSKAEAEADGEAWTTTQVRDFQQMQERTPANHQELFDLAVQRMLDLKDDLEEGDSSDAQLLQKIDDEVLIRKYIGGLFRKQAQGRYSIEQEVNLADEKEPDMRFLGHGFDGPVPVELKIADKWTGPQLFERLRNQLCGDYLRDIRSGRGVFLLVYRGVANAQGVTRKHWELPDTNEKVDFAALVSALQDYWGLISEDFPGIDDVKVIGIDLTKRLSRKGK